MEYVRLEQSKRCSKCKQIKLPDDFCNLKSSKDGKDYRCRDCKRQEFKAWATRNAEYNYQRNKQWRAANPELSRATKNAWNRANPEKARARTRAWVAANPDKKRANNIAWEKANPEKIKAKGRNWAANNPHKVAQANLRRQSRVRAKGIYAISKKEVTKLLSLPCFYCGAFGKQTLDHVIPVSRGGAHSIGNLVTACKSCNSSKQAHTIMEWRKKKA